MALIRTKGDSGISVAVPYNYGDVEFDFIYRGQSISDKEYTKMMLKEYMDHDEGIKQGFNKVNGNFGKNLAINNMKKEPVKVKQIGTYFSDTKVNIYHKNGEPMVIDYLCERYQDEKPFILVMDMYELMNTDDEDAKKISKNELEWDAQNIGSKFDLRINFMDKEDYTSVSDISNLESDIKSWAKETLKVNNSPKINYLIDEDGQVVIDRRTGKPTKNPDAAVIKLKSYSKKTLVLKFKGASSKVVLHNCKMIDVKTKTKYVFLVERVTFITDK